MVIRSRTARLFDSPLRKEKGSEAPGWVIRELEAQGLLDIAPDGSQSLSSKGRLLAYNIAEFIIQVEHRKFLPVLEKLNVCPGSIVLDVGCGGGQTLFALADRQPSLVLGMDRDAAHLEIAQSLALNFPLRNGSFAFQQADGNFLPVKDDSVDVLICRGVLHYLNIRQALQEMRRVLKPGGRLFIHAVGLRGYMEQLLKSNFRGKLHSLFVIFNGIFYCLTGRQITLKHKKRPLREVFFTAKSLRTLEGMGFKIKSLELFPENFPVGHYGLVAEKSGPLDPDVQGVKKTRDPPAFS